MKSKVIDINSRKAIPEPCYREIFSKIHNYKLNFHGRALGDISIEYLMIPTSILHDIDMSHIAYSILVYVYSVPRNVYVKEDSMKKNLKISNSDWKKAIDELVKLGYVSNISDESDDEIFVTLEERYENKFTY